MGVFYKKIPSFLTFLKNKSLKVALRPEYLKVYSCKHYEIACHISEPQ